MDLDTRNIPPVIYACFVLHNFCETRGIHINPDRVAAQVIEEATTWVVAQVVKEAITQQCEHPHNCK